MIDQDIERELTSGTSHGHGCWEAFAEKAVEAGRATTGRHDDEVDGLTLWLHYLDFIAEGGCENEIGCPEPVCADPVCIAMGHGYGDCITE